MGRAYQNRKESMAKTSDMKAKVYSRYGREIYVSAKSGGLDPSANLALRSLIDRAKKDQVPGHVIDKAIEKAKGGGGEDYSPARYEGYGPGGVAILVECMTDNKNRTVGEVRHAFTKHGGNLGTSGSVAYLFDKRGQFVFGDNYNEDDLMEAALEAGAEDFIAHDDGSFEVLTTPETYLDVKDALKEAGFEAENAEVTMLPSTQAELDVSEGAKVIRLIDRLEELDDTQNVYTNADIPAESYDNL